MVVVVTAQGQTISTKTINTTGAGVSAGGITLEWSVGEMVAIQTFISPNNILTQGLLQPPVSANAPLPVTLLFFTAKRANQEALLSWATSREINNHHFDVERSPNGIDFQVLKQVAGAGNSAVPKTYSLTDPAPYLNTYYRLKQVDVDGKFSYSRIVPIQFTETFKYRLYPNPTKGTLYLAHNGSNKVLAVCISDMNGKIVLEKHIYPTNTISIDVNHLANGSYFIKVLGSSNWSGKFVKQ